MPKRRHPESVEQSSRLSPTDAAMVHLLRRFIAEASRIYEVKTGRALSDALEIRNPRDAYEFLRFEMEGLDQEQMRTINLNTARGYALRSVPIGVRPVSSLAK